MLCLCFIVLVWCSYGCAVCTVLVRVCIDYYLMYCVCLLCVHALYPLHSLGLSLVIPHMVLHSIHCLYLSTPSYLCVCVCVYTIELKAHIQAHSRARAHSFLVCFFFLVALLVRACSVNLFKGKSFNTESFVYPLRGNVCPNYKQKYSLILQIVL